MVYIRTIRSVVLLWSSAVVFGLVGCSGDSKSVLERLSDQGYAFHATDFHRAATAGEIAVVELFMASGMALETLDKNGRTALLSAARAGQSEMARRLVQWGAAPNVCDEEGRTPLIHAACAGDVALVKDLLAVGADSQMRDQEGWSALTGAALPGHADVVALLADCEAADVDRALHLACVGGDVATVGALLRAGGSVYARSSEEKTALMYAAANGHLSAVKLLVRNGANRYAIDQQMQTAAQLARASAFHEVADLLEEPQMTDWLDLSPEDTLAGGSEAADPTAADVVGEGDSLGDLEQRLEDAERALQEHQVAAGKAGAEDADEHPDQSMPGAPERLDAAYNRATLAAAGDGVDKFAPGSPFARRGATQHEIQSVSDAWQQSTDARNVSTRNRRMQFMQHVDGGGSWRCERLDGIVMQGALLLGGEDAASGLRRGAYEESFSVLRMHGYRESQLPVILMGVSTRDGIQRGIVRLLYGGSADRIEVAENEMISDSGLRVIELQRRVAQTKAHLGMSVDVSRMIVENVDSGERVLLVRGVPAMSNKVHAVVRLDNDLTTVYEARPNDRFAAAGGRDSYRVLDVRPKQMVILHESSGDTLTVMRTR